MLSRIDRVGASVVRAGASYTGLAFLAYAAAKGLVIERARGFRVVFRTMCMQIYFTAIEPLPIFLVVALIFGFVVIVATDLLLPRYGLHAQVPHLIAAALTREVGPLVIAMILIGRTGTAVATELGYMKLNRELEALSAMGVNIDYFVILPRFIGITAATSMLVVIFVGFALVGGYALAQLVGLISVTLLFRELIAAVSFTSIAFGLTKAVIFGASIALSACWHGLTVEGSLTSLPRANSAGVVQSMLLCFIVNALVSVYAIL